MRKSIVLSLLGWSVLSLPVAAQSFYPRIYAMSPCAVQAGQSIECEISAEHSFHGATTVLVSGADVKGEVVPVKAKDDGKPPRILGASSIKVRFQAAAGAAPGVRDVRLLTPRGPSTLAQLVVVSSPTVREMTSPHANLETAQNLAVPSAVCGRIGSNEEVDFYKFHVAAKTALTFDMVCQRLQQKSSSLTYHADPIMALRNAAGQVLAVNDNFHGADPVLHHRFAQAGDYYLEVRDVRYKGYRHWEYCIEIHDRPVVLQAIPASLPPGVPTRVRLLGFNLPDDAQTTLHVPADALEGQQWITPTLFNGKSLNRLPVYVSRLPAVAETVASNDAPAQAQPITVPAGISGLIEKADDVDCYAFDARKGERFSFTVVAHSLGSKLDSYLRILDAKGEPVIENDDGSDKTSHEHKRNEFIWPDSRILDWAAPADGRYTIEIRDVHLRGGKDFPYFLEVRRGRPHFLIELDSDRTVLAPGMTGLLFVRAFRQEGFDGTINLAIEGLPRGVTAVCGSITPKCQDGCIFLTAAADSARDMVNIRVIGTSTATKDVPAQTVVARPMQEIQVDGGARYLDPVSLHSLAVVDKLDLGKVTANPKTLTIKPGESKTVDITIERMPGFKEPVTLAAFHRQHVWVYGAGLPPGVTVDEAASRVRLVGDQTVGTLVLKADPKAQPIENHMVPIMANVAINFSMKMIYVSEPLRLTVATK